MGKATERVLACATGVLACLEGDPAKLEACRKRAGDRCAKYAGTIAAAREKLGSDVGRACGSVDFDVLRQPSGAFLDALVCECDAVGVGALQSLDAYGQCLDRQEECRIAELVPFAVPRVAEALAAISPPLDVQDLLCGDVATPLAAARIRFPAGIKRFIANVLRARDRTTAIYHAGGAPVSGPGAPRTISSVFSRGRVVPGASGRFLVRYSAGGGARDARANGNPSLIVAIRRLESSLADDFYELALDAPAGEVEIETQYSASLPSCAFELAFATRDADGVVSEYVDSEVVPVGCHGAPNGIVEAGEQCDDGNAIDGDACTNVCAPAVCGDGVVRTGVETCDDGNFTTADGCESDCTPTPPCTIPTVIPAAGGTFNGMTIGTSTLMGSCGSGATGPERVFQWTPAFTGTAQIETCGGGTSYDTVLYMRQGSCTAGAEVAGGCNDDACTNAIGANRASRITPVVTAGQTYFIDVDGFGGAQGSFSLKVAPCGNVGTIGAGGSACGILGSTVGSPDLQDGTCRPSSAPERVFTWTPNFSGDVEISTCSSSTNFDTVLYVRQSTCAGTEITCNDDIASSPGSPTCSVGSGSLTSRVLLTVQSGTTYFVFVDGFSTAQGTFNLIVRRTGDICIP